MCFHTGYRKRTGIFEILPFSRALREKITQRAPRDELLATIRREGGYSSLLDDARALVLRGVTTAEEAYRTVHTSED